MRLKSPMVSILIIVILGIVAYCFRGQLIQALHDGNQVPVANTNFEVIAHRGASAYAPENTMPAFEKALEMNADYIELDLHLSKDSVAVVIHDATLERTTDGIGTVKSKTWEELKTLDAGTWFGKGFETTKLSSFSEVLSQVNGRAKLLVELKIDDQSNVYENLVEIVAKNIADANAQEWCVLQAFSSEYLKQIKEQKLAIEYHKLIVDEYSPLPMYVDTQLQWGSLNYDLGYKGLNPYYATLTPGRIKHLRSMGFKVFPYTVNEVADMRLLLNWGVSGLITNYPDKAIELKSN